MNAPSWIDAVSDGLGEPIAAIDGVSRHALGTTRVWRITAESGRQFAVKHYVFRSPQTVSGHDALETETATLSLLSEMNARVPTLAVADRAEGVIVTEWLTGATLDDLAQREPEAVRRSVPRAIEALGFIERAFDGRIAEVEPFAFEQDYDAYLGGDFTATLHESKQGYDELCAYLGGESNADESTWFAILNVIQSSEPTLGTLDYNARNLIVTPNDVAYLDFSAVGWDWRERRLVQYLTALGSHDPDGAFVSALTEETLTAARDVLFFDSEALEAHHFVFMCLIVERLLRGGIEPPDDITDEQRPYWENRRARFNQAVEILALGGLTEFPATRALRESVARTRRPR